MYNTQLDTFIHVVDTGSFAKAAKVLYISTTAVIKKINQWKPARKAWTLLASCLKAANTLSVT